MNKAIKFHAAGLAWMVAGSILTVSVGTRFPAWTGAEPVVLPPAEEDVSPIWHPQTTVEKQRSQSGKSFPTS